MARDDLTKGWLRGPGFVPLAPDVYVPADVLVDQVTMARVAMLRHPEGTIAGTTAALFHGAIDAVVDVGRRDAAATGERVAHDHGLDGGQCARDLHHRPGRRGEAEDGALGAVGVVGPLHDLVGGEVGAPHAEPGQ